MISLKLTDTKAFMSHLLVKNTFDSLLLYKAELSMSYSFTLDGSVNKSFYSEDELNGLEHKEYTQWSTIKSFCYSFIKGSKVPTGMKVIFIMSDDVTSQILKDSGSSLKNEDVEGLFINVNYKDDAVSIVTGTSFKEFSLDKSVDKAFDNYVRQLLEQHEIPYVEET